MDQMKGHLSYSQEAEKQWACICNETKNLIMCYQSLLIFYMKAEHRERWGSKLGRNAMSPWTPADVLDEIIHQRETLINLGASPDYFEVISTVKETLDDEPEIDADREEFCEVLNRLIEGFPFNSLRDKRVVVVSEDRQRLTEIEPNYYRSKCTAQLHALTVNDHIEAYFTAIAAEKERIRYLTDEEFWGEFLETEEPPSQEVNPQSPGPSQTTSNGGSDRVQKSEKLKNSVKSKGRRRRRYKGLGDKSDAVRSLDHGSRGGSPEIIMSGTESSSPTHFDGSDPARQDPVLSTQRRKRKADTDHFDKQGSEEEAEDILESTPPAVDVSLEAPVEDSHTPASPVQGNSTLESFSGATDLIESPPRTPIQRRKVTRRYECTEIEEAPLEEEE